MISITPEKLKKLQNGSDIRGVALAGVAGEEPNLTAAEARVLTFGFLLWLQKKTGKKAEDLTVSIGHDPRLSGDELAAAAAGALCERGVRVLDCGLASTPAMFMSTVFEADTSDGAIMITASHLPWNRNGFKYFTAGGGLEKADIRAIIDMGYEAFEDGLISPLAPEHSGPACTVTGEAGPACAACSVPCGASFKATKPEPADLMARYAEHLRALISKALTDQGAGGAPLADLHIVVDAGNGAGGFYATEVLEPLGADISGSLFLEPDGHFPNHAPNPENKEAMHAISEAVLKSHADLGIIFDTDVDRSAAVDETGREIARNGIVAMAAALIAEDHPGSTVVTDSITSKQLGEFLTGRLGLKHLRFKRGYRNVINKSIELNAAGTDSWLAIETSGHAALKENYFLDDGAYLATKIVIKTALLHREGKAVSSVIEDLAEPLEAREVRFPIAGEDFAATGDRILEDLKAFVNAEIAAGHTAITLEEPNYEGVRINFDAGHGDGWCLLRKSLHDPIMPLNLESDSKGGTDIMASILRDFLKKYDALDISAL